MSASAEHPMEIRTGRGIAWVFTIVGLGGVVGISLAVNDVWAFVPTAFFAMGAIAGISLLLRPKLLLSIRDHHLVLYTGALLHSRPKISIPLDDIGDYEVHLNHEGDGSSWFLTLHLKQPKPLSESADQWIRSTTKFTSLANDDPSKLHWMLTWPQGGGNRVQTELNQHLRPAITSAP